MITAHFDYSKAQPWNLNQHMPTRPEFDVDAAIERALNGGTDFVTEVTLQRAASLFYQLDCNGLSAKEIADFIVGQEQHNQFT